MHVVCLNRYGMVNRTVVVHSIKYVLETAAMVTPCAWITYVIDLPLASACKID